MRANIPRNPTPRGGFELEGRYLQAMQSISTSLMEVLPDGERLWEILGKTEALLLEAQMTHTPVEELFPHGGVAGFCQSIIDEYKTEQGQAPAQGKTAVPASKDKKTRKAGHSKTPRGGEGARRYRRVTKLLTVLAILLVAAALIWQSGFLRFLVKGSAFYHEELHNFENTIMEPRGEELTFTIPLSPTAGLGQVIYADPEGYTVTLDALNSRERVVQGIGEDGKPANKRIIGWHVTLLYTVDAGFSRVRMVTPEPRGTAILTLADGTTYESTLSSDSSGPASRGLEYISITVLDGIPKDTDLRGATLTVTMTAPIYRVWERVGMGAR